MTIVESEETPLELESAEGNHQQISLLAPSPGPKAAMAGKTGYSQLTTKK